jgi:hypothetical protein
VLLIFPLFLGCYSVGIASKHAIPDPDMLNNEHGYYHHKNKVELKETLKLGVPDNHVIDLENLGSRGFHSVEYRVTLGDVLLSAVTFGKVRKMRLIYVAEKEDN